MKVRSVGCAGVPGRVMDVLTLAFLAGLSVWLWLVWPEVSGRVPTHYGMLGQIDGWGDKSMVLVLWGMAWGLFALISAVELCPGCWNTGVEVTDDNREQVYRVLLMLTKSTKLLMALVMGYIVVCSVLAVSVGVWLLPGFVLAMTAMMVYWLRRLYRLRPEKADRTELKKVN